MASEYSPGSWTAHADWDWNNRWLGTVPFAADACAAWIIGVHIAKTLTSGGSTTAVNDVYQLGHVAYETDATGTVLASFSYDSEGVPTSVRVGSDPTTAPVYYYVYIGHGDTIALTDATGLVVASYSYDPWGVVTSDTEAFSNGWHNPYLYDGRDGARYDQETGLYWLAVRAYDPTLGRFNSRDPLGRAPLFGWSDQPYVYAGNNPLVNVDPSGQRFATEGAAQTRTAVGYQRRVVARVQVRRGTAPKPVRACRRPGSHPTCDQIDAAKSAAYTAAAAFGIVGGLIGVIDTTLGKLKDFLLGQISRLFGWNNARTLATIAAAAGVLGTIFAEVMIVGALFFAQAILSDDSYWENPGNLNAFEATLEFGTILGNIVLGLAAFVSAMAVIVEEPPAGAFLAGVTAGAILSLLSLPILIGEAVQNERSKLGY